MTSAPFDRCPENVHILPVVVTELELGNIERHIFAAHFVERADYAAFENRPEAFDGLSVDRANDILTTCMVNSHVWIILIERIVARILIGAKQTDPVRHRFADERGESGGIHVRDYARNDVPLATDSADDWRFARAGTSGSTAATAFITMSVFRQAADESFINFDNAAELINVFHQGDADLVTHGPSCLIRAEAHIALNLQRAHALLAGEHQMNDAIPITKRLVGIFEYRSGDVGEAIASFWSTLIALPAPWPVQQFMRVLCATTWAANAIWPAAANEISAARIFVREHPLELSDRELMDWFRLFACHVAVSFDYGRTLA